MEGSRRAQLEAKRGREKKYSAQTTSDGAAGYKWRSASAPSNLQLTFTAGVTNQTGRNGHALIACRPDAVSSGNDSRIWEK